MYLNVLKILKNNIFCLYQFDIHFAFLFVSVIVGRYAATMDLQNRYPQRFAGGVACMPLSRRTLQCLARIIPVLSAGHSSSASNCQQPDHALLLIRRRLAWLAALVFVTRGVPCGNKDASAKRPDRPDGRRTNNVCGGNRGLRRITLYYVYFPI